MSIFLILAKLITLMVWPLGLVTGSVMRGLRGGFWYGYTRSPDATRALVVSGLNDKLREDGLRLKGDI